MGLRFRKSIKLGGGTRINISKTGIPGVVLHGTSHMILADATRPVYGFFAERSAEVKDIDKQTT